MGWQRCCPIHECRVTIEMQDSRRRWLTVQHCQKGDKAWCVIAIGCKGTPRAGLFAGVAIGGNQQLSELREVGLSANLYHYEACARTTEPKNRRGDLVGTAQPGDGLIAHDLFDGVRLHSPT